MTVESIRDWARWQKCLSDGAPSMGAKKANFAQATAKSIEYPHYPKLAEQLDKVIAGWATTMDDYEDGAGTMLFNCLRSVNERISSKDVCRRLKIKQEQLEENIEEAIDITHACLYPETRPEWFR